MAPLAALLLLILLGFCALVLDVGLVYAHRRALQNAADAAALAGAREVQRKLLGASADPAGLAAHFAAQNGVLAEDGACTRGDAATVLVNRGGSLPHSWEVEVGRAVPLVFGPAVGVTQLCVRARALGVVVAVHPTKIWPFGVLASTPRVPGATVVLKAGAFGVDEGNFGILDFTCGGRGADEYGQWLFNGFGAQPGERVPMRIPPGVWSVCTAPGNKATVNQAFAAYVAAHRHDACLSAEPDVRCPLIGLVPVLREAEWPPGASAPVHIVDFAVLRIEQVEMQPGVGLMDITGRFLARAGGVGPTYPPDPDGTLRGLIGVRLWE